MSVKVRAYPTPAQARVLDTYFSHARLIYNLAVQQQKYYVKGSASAKNIPGKNQRYLNLTELRNTYDWLQQTPAIILQQALADFNTAQNRFITSGVGKPKYKSYSRNNHSFRIVGKDSLKIRKLHGTKWQVHIPKLGWVHITCHRQPPKHFKSYTVRKDPAGRYYVSFTSIPSIKKTKPKPNPSEESRICGIDLGIVHSITTSDGVFYDFDRTDLYDKIIKLQQEFDRKQKGSKNRAKARIKLARAHVKLANARQYFIQKTTTELAKQYDIIVMENLSVKDMTVSIAGTVDDPGVGVSAKSSLNEAILDKSWGYIKHCLMYKMPGRLYGVNPAYTSIKCSVCGNEDPANRRSQATFKCVNPKCGFEANADINAAVNIKQAKKRVLLSEVPVSKPYKRKSRKGSVNSQRKSVNQTKNSSSKSGGVDDVRVRCSHSQSGINHTTSVSSYSSKIYSSERSSVVPNLVSDSNSDAVVELRADGPCMPSKTTDNVVDVGMTP